MDSRARKRQSQMESGYKIPLNPPLQKGEAGGMPELIEILPILTMPWVPGENQRLIFHISLAL